MKRRGAIWALGLVAIDNCRAIQASYPIASDEQTQIKVLTARTLFGISSMQQSVVQLVEILSRCRSIGCIDSLIRAQNEVDFLFFPAF